MDLYAYAQIANLEPLLEMNGIKDIKRLRGLRLMGAEEPVTKKQIDEEIYHSVASFMKYDMSYRFADNHKSRFLYQSDLVDIFKNYFCYGNGQPRWDRIHGKLRKTIKFEIKKQKKATRKQYEMFNKYAGRDDVLYIHTRLGSSNWSYYKADMYKKEPWFLGKVDDSFDCTYCDIYAKIDPETIKQLPVPEETEETNEE